MESKSQIRCQAQENHYLVLLRSAVNYKVNLGISKVAASSVPGLLLEFNKKMLRDIAQALPGEEISVF